jgi:predicted HNH restriction endonuclease
VAEVLPDVPSLGVRDYRRLGRLYALKKVPRGSEQGRPLQEYYSQENFFGIFGRRAEAFDVAKFALFLTSTLRALPEFNAVDAYPKRKSEGRRAVGWHLRIERNHSLANSCKRRDGYRCQICRFHFTEAYGNLGERFAEAHHVVHLSKLKGPTENSAAHLRTVCSNCHRMLHRMQGSPSDIQRLKKLLRIRHVEI